MQPARSTRELTALLEAGARTPIGPREKQQWFEALLVWVLKPDGLGRRGPAVRTTRLRLLGRVLDAHPHRERLLARMQEVWSHASAVRLLAETGLPDWTTFFAEAAQRLTDLFLPTLDPGDDLYALVDRLGLGETDARWLEGLDKELRERWKPIFAPTQRAFAGAAELLAYRTAALGLSRDLLLYQPGSVDLASPFYQLPQAVHAWAQAGASKSAREQWERVHADCLGALRAIHRELDRRGVSTDLVFRLDLVAAALGRIAALLALRAGEGDGHQLASELVRGSATQHSLLVLLRSTLQRLARKVVEHTAETGEHYIANTKREWLRMLASAAGGGALTAATACIKYLLAALPLAPALMGAAHSLNYSASFMSMQLLGFSLASKQPAMTGSALADALEQESGIEAEVDLVASISRTQFIAAVGNVFACVPVALLIDLLLRLLTGHPLLSPEHAEQGLRDLHPLRSGTLPFAALTGVFLWLSSLAAGWGANWSAFRSLPEAVARSRRVRRFFGEGRAQRLGALVKRHLSGAIGYLVLGFLLGFVPVLFKFVGLGIEVRHVTLSSGALAFDASALFSAHELDPIAVLWAILGIALIGMLNFGVSFALALRVALQARGLALTDRRELLRALWRTFSAEPARFLLAPKTGPRD